MKKVATLSINGDAADLISNRLSLQLYPHQKIALKALMDAEATPQLGTFEDLYDREYSIGYNTRNVTTNGIIMFNSVIYRDPLGSGKTFVILALVLKDIPTHITQQNVITRGYGAIVRNPTRILRPTIIVVSSATFAQWVGNITGYTSARIMYITSTNDILKLRAMIDGDAAGSSDQLSRNKLYMNQNSLNLIDGILVKSMSIIGFDGVRTNTCNQIGIITGAATWNRVVYDDFDTIRTCMNSKIIPAISTIYVSGSAKFTGGHRVTNYFEHPFIIDRHFPTVRSIQESDSVMRYNKIRCGTALIASSMTMPIIEHYSYVFTNPHDSIIEIVNHLDTSITEMLNADAFASAADMLGITSTSIGDIFKRVLDDKFNIHQTSARILEIITEFRGQKSDGMTRLITSAEVCELIRQCKLPNCAWKDEYIYPVASLESEARTSFNEADKAIARVKDNLKSGECQICYNSLDNQRSSLDNQRSSLNNQRSLESAIINRCCGVILCTDCGIRGNRLHERDGSVQGKCGYCNRALNAAEDLIFVNRDVPLSDMLAMTIVPITEDISNNVSSDTSLDTTNSAEVPLHPKVQTLINIFTGLPNTCTRIEPIYANVIAGTIDNPGNRPRKVIVYAAYRETFVACAAAADDAAIPYLILRNNNSKEVLKTFAMSETMILFAKYSTACAGLDLQHATDLVIMHRIMNPVEMEQIIGRIQRMGRYDNARVHYLTYRNEQNLLD